jgi:hypothetical protein
MTNKKNISLVVISNDRPLINDFIEWHKKYKFDRYVIFNNCSKDEDLFRIEGTEEIDARGLEAAQLKCYQSFIDQMNFNDWCLMLDSDELLDIQDCDDVHDFLEPYKNCDTVRLNWKCYGDNGELHYRAAPIWERFPEPCDMNVVYNDKLTQQGITENMHIKSFYRRTFKPSQANIHTVMVAGSCAVNTRMEPQIGDSPFQEICWDKAFVRHYNTLSTEEFCKRRLNKLDCCGNKVGTDEELIRFYKNENGWSEEKEKVYAEFKRTSKSV